MRKIEFSELKFKDINDEETFYQVYLKNLNNSAEEDNELKIPEKQYEIFYLNILDGKLILLNKDYINNNDYSDIDLFFDYKTALKIYNLMLDIKDGIEDEKNEFNELYKDERLQKNIEIGNLRKQDDELFKKKQIEYNAIINSDMYKKYFKTEEENKQLKIENEKLKKEIEDILIEKNKKIGFFQRLLNRFKNKRLPKN